MQMQHVAEITDNANAACSSGMEQDSKSGPGSTSTENQFIDLENAIRNHVDESNGIYRSCCTMIDSRVLSFAVQSVVIILVLIFSMYQAANTSSLEARQTYIVIVTTILSVYLPTPKIRRDNNRNNNRS
jgi:hypothetical protein